MAYFRISGLAPHAITSASSADILKDNGEEGEAKVTYTAILGDSDTVSEGTMPNNKKLVFPNLNCGQQQTIQLGYYDGTSSITANDLASQTSGDTGDILAEAKYILHGQTAWIKGKLVTGTATFTIE